MGAFITSGSEFCCLFTCILVETKQRTNRKVPKRSTKVTRQFTRCSRYGTVNVFTVLVSDGIF